MRAHIGYVPQKAYLFTGTIDMNVRYGAASGQVLSVEDVENACHLAKADEFINRLDGGYQYTVSQGGTNLSGGQRQRLAMARALVRKPDLFIFDDSFSALDGTTERAVRTALHEELQKGQSASPHFCGAKGKCRKKSRPYSNHQQGSSCRIWYT